MMKIYVIIKATLPHIQYKTTTIVDAYRYKEDADYVCSTWNDDETYKDEKVFQYSVTEVDYYD